MVNNMQEEKELTIEEMKSLVSLATLLPALLEKISIINKDIADLKSSFAEIKVKFNNNAKVVDEYKKAVDSLVEKQPNIKPIQDDLNFIKQVLMNRIDLMVGKEKPENEKTTKKSPTSIDGANKAKAKDPDKDKVEEIVDRILAEHKGRKTRMLTVLDIKNGFRVDDVIAAKVLKWFEDHKMYNAKMRMLTFPKR